MRASAVAIEGARLGSSRKGRFRLGIAGKGTQPAGSISRLTPALPVYLQHHLRGDPLSVGCEDAAALGDAGSDAGDAADGVGFPVPLAALAEGD